MEPVPTLDVLLHLDRDTVAISGSLENDLGARRPFHGWLELSALLDDVRAAGSPGESDP
ncbi:MAG TPA: hypothetical protein VMU75_02290 [Acidimicrobiales bacterium]|nr:hypothetical protein [Acidimicrobiales bacterium]